VTGTTEPAPGHQGAAHPADDAVRRTPVPLPAHLVWGDGVFPLHRDTPVDAPDEVADEVAWLRGALGAATGCRLPAGESGLAVRLDADLGPEAYRLDIRPAHVRLVGGDRAGVFHGMQTLRQLMHPDALRSAPVGDRTWAIPAVSVRDRPRHRWRGVLLDVARHFLRKADVLRFVDLMAVHHLNVLHLHLTDDQGWRLEVPGWPRLTEVGAWRHESMVGTRHHPKYDGRPHGGYYTRADLREIVAYAAAQHITVVPEVDLPGHVQSVLAAYPELGAGPRRAWTVRTGWGLSDAVLTVGDAALDFCRDVLDEVCRIFPGRYVGVGGDEVPREPWRADPAARERARELGLPDTDGLQRWFTAQLADMLAAHGRTLFGWDEILEDGAPPGALIGGWRGTHGVTAALAAGHDVVAGPDTSVYLDYRQSDHPDEPIPIGTLVTLADIHAFDPVPPGATPEQAQRVLGGQAALWSEQLDSPRAVDYAAFPRLCAFAEALWTNAAPPRDPNATTPRDPDAAPPRDTDAFLARLDRDHLPRLDALGVEYRPLTGPLPWQTRPDTPGFPKTRATREAELHRLTSRLPQTP
jgi:hexosaminidase